VIWLFSTLAAFSLMFIIHVFMKVDRNAALAGIFLIVLTLSMEFLNQWLGPFWIAQDSIYLISAGLPIEKLLLYGMGGTFACKSLINNNSYSARTPLGTNPSLKHGAKGNVQGTRRKSVLSYED